MLSLSRSLGIMPDYLPISPEAKPVKIITSHVFNLINYFTLNRKIFALLLPYYLISKETSVSAIME